MKPSIGKTSAGDLIIDVPRLLETRMLLQASSGGGKSWALRRILEQTAGHVQQVILDIEGEFPTLREKFDYVICAPHGADAVATPQTATILARRLRETRVSAIIDMYELKMPERKRFVRLFLEEFVEAPKSMWHPCLVVIDEAHHFAPQHDEAESISAVNDLITRGRKRGLCGLLATQRLSKLSKDSAAELHNKLIGLAVLDTDVKRAADDLGLSPKETMPLLRNLEPGEFFAFGPALVRTVTKVKVGPVVTTHPKAGTGTLTRPPEPSEKIKALLAKLTDLPKEAEQEARTVADFKRENAQLKRDLTIAKRVNPAPAKVEIKIIEKPVVGKQAAKGLFEACRELRKISAKTLDTHKASCDALAMIAREADKIIERLEKVTINPVVAVRTLQPVKPRPALALLNIAATRTVGGNGSTPEMSGVVAGALRMLSALAQWHPEGMTGGQMRAHAGLRKSGTFSTYLSRLRSANLIEQRNGLYYASEAGLDYCGERRVDMPATTEEIVALWKPKLKGAGAQRMLDVLVNYGGEPISKERLFTEAGFTSEKGSSGTFSTYLSRLRTARLVKTFPDGAVAADKETLLL